LADCCQIDPTILAEISYQLYCKVTNYITKLPTLFASHNRHRKEVMPKHQVEVCYASSSADINNGFQPRSRWGSRWPSAENPVDGGSVSMYVKADL